MKQLSFILFFALLLSNKSNAQSLKPGFDKDEYLSTIEVGRHIEDSVYPGYPKEPKEFSYVYISPEMGLKNKWALWKRKSDGAAVINLRGTINDNISWLANIYCGMVPAKGALTLGENDIFNYNLSDYDRAYVHIGWLVSFAYLSKDMRPKIDSLIAHGSKSFIISGHSQGGALTYFVTAWMKQLQKHGEIPSDIQIKTYSSASPKPGNLYFAYDYESQTQNGWAYNVVNSADWVPESPYSFQTLSDMNPSPFDDVTPIVKKQKFPKNIVLKGIYNKLKKQPEKTVKTYRKYLGNMTGGMIAKYLKGYKQPELLYDMYYVRAGNQITLLADSAYFVKYPKNSDNKFLHHGFEQYTYLIERNFKSK